MLTIILSEKQSYGQKTLFFFKYYSIGRLRNEYFMFDDGYKTHINVFVKNVRM